MQMAYSIVFFCLCGDFELVVDNCFTGQVNSSISYIPKCLLVFATLRTGVPIQQKYADSALEVIKIVIRDR